MKLISSIILSNLLTLAGCVLSENNQAQSKHPAHKYFSLKLSFYFQEVMIVQIAKHASFQWMNRGKMSNS